MRTATVTIIVGRRKSGKTDYSKLLLQSLDTSKILIVDTFDNPPWRNWKTHNHPERENVSIPIMAIEQLPYWKNGSYRMFSNDLSPIFSAIDKNLMNSAILFEDATKYIGSKLEKPVRNSVIDSKQKNIDLFFVFHSLSAVPPELVRISDFITIFKTNEAYPSTKKYPFPDIIPAMDFVKNSKNLFEKVTLPLN